MAESMRRFGSIVLIGLPLLFQVHFVGSQPVMAVACAAYRYSPRWVDLQAGGRCCGGITL